MTHLLAIIRAFAGRYRDVFKAAWAERGMLDPPRRSADELAFLPAHLELTDTPAFPASRWIMRTIAAIFCIALAWACRGTLDVVAIAPGKTVASGRTKVIQPLEAGIVKRIAVEDGQTVRAGQLLVELDATAAHAASAQAGEALLVARLAQLRLEALVDAYSTGQPPLLAANPGLPEARYEAEQRLATGQFLTLEARRSALAAALHQRQAELATTQSLLEPMRDNARIAKEREEDYARLLDGQYVGRHDYLLRRQERIAAERDWGTQRQRTVELRAAISAAQHEVQVLGADVRQQTLESLRQAREQIGQYIPEVAKAGQREGLTQLRAPVHGTVQQLTLHTVGGVVTPAQSLMTIVPSGDELEVEATVLNKDIGFVRRGQRATIKVESFPYTRYGYLEGEVMSISHDAAQDEVLGPVFPARVKLITSTLIISGEEVSLTPGMSLRVEIKIGRRRIVDYLTEPLQANAAESMRER